MLENLHVKDLKLISEADISFKKGFNILTGETGAGKSIVLGSINLALGERASSADIRDGAESALVELSFVLNEDEIAKLRAMDFEVDDDGSVLLTRKLTSSKSISRINGETVTQSQLKELAPILLDMYGQHENQTLLKNSTYLNMLDHFIGDEISDYQKALSLELTEYKELEKKLLLEDTDENVRSRQIELLEYEINEIDSAKLIVGEDEELEKRYRFLNNVQKIAESIQKTYVVTGYDGEGGAGSLIGVGVNALKQVAALDDEADNLHKQLSEIENLLNDFNRSIGGYLDSLEFDGEEYNEVTERLNTINHLKDKYGASIEAILATYESKCEELNKLSNYEEYLENTKKKLGQLRKSMINKCEAISKLRNEYAEPLALKLTSAMESLNFMDVKLKIEITSDAEHIMTTGYDSVEFMISLNTGEALRPMNKIASGGELSRIMLAIKSVFAKEGGLSTLIFDEIDTGISGVTAYKVAETMKQLSADHQIICITHLPQIAAMADTHFLIEKTAKDGRTNTDILELDEEGSVKELARMLGTDEITESALENARALKARQ